MKKMTKNEFEKKLNTIETVKADAIDIEMMKEIEAEDDSSSVSLSSVVEKREYSGKILVRIPKDLHLELVEAAEDQGVSLNQYCLYKLAR